MESAKTKRVCLLKIYVLKYKWKCQYVKVMAYFIISVRVDTRRVVMHVV